ncbi:hypothetical protein [Streptomyces sp. NRRL B-24484]|uniref:hypothetical protein n=1 Tax=Streptomyces sp. NRRL B-24484 TaxID=1463833 RepID=UPI000694F8BC|nr:hypothetical protein [Streptomyces sp. NRRL B-24484]
MTTSGTTTGGPKAPGHARSGLKHWALVAAGCGAVVAGALAADPAQGTPTPVRSTAEPVPTAAAPDPGKAELPLDCGPVGVSVALRASATVDGVPSTVVAAHCAAGNGTPPDGVYLLTNGPDGRPQVTGTLLDPVKDGLTVTALTIRSDGAIRGHAQGWSSDDVPRCCPDRAVDLSWTRQGESWVRAQSAVPAGQV